MESQPHFRGVGMAWIGTVGAWVTTELISVWIGITAGALASIYTAMKIWDWIQEKRNQRPKFPGPHS